MWSQLLICCLVGFAFANNSNPAWKDNTEYSYIVRGRTLASLNEVSNQYTGILLKAKLTIIPQSNGKLYAKISESQYGQIHSELANGWNTYIPDSQVGYKQLPLTEKYFEIVMEEGVIRDLIVSKEVSNWEANIIRSIVSQFQLDTNAKNLIPSHVNALPEGQQNNAVFKTMEDTINGQSETLYDIHALPEYVLQSKPWLAPKHELRGEGEVIEIVKSKNFTNSKQRPSFYYGLSGMDQWEPTTNQMGEFFTRTSNSRAVVTGTLKRYTVQNSYTVNKIVMSPTLNDDKKGSVVSMLNVTLQEVRPQSEKPQEVSQPINLGDLVYRFNKPYSTNQVRGEYRGQENTNQGMQRSSEEMYVAHPRLFRRSVEEQLRSEEQYQKQERYMEQYWNEQQQQEQPKMDKAPQTPLLPFTIGYKGQSIKTEQGFNVVEKVEKLCQEIGQYVQQPETILEKFVLDKFTILTQLVRIMNADELQKVSQKVYSQEQHGQKYAAWIAFRDAVAQAGTGPAFLTIEKWIQTDKIQSQEAAVVISTMARVVREPTVEYIRKFFELIKSEKIQSQDQLLRNSVHLSFGNLLRRVYVEKRESHNAFPVHVYGKFYNHEGKTYMRQTIIPYYRQQLEQAISQSKTEQIHMYIRTLGNIADREILSVFEPYMEGQKQCSQFQRLMMVVSLDKLTYGHPELARSVLYKIYQNAGESQEIRVAAVYQLMRTSPPTDMLQRMAQATHFDEHDDVNAAVKSSIETAAQLKGEQYKNLRSSARAAKPLLTKKNFGLRQSQNYLRSYVLDEMKVGYKQVVQTIIGQGSFIPKSVKYSLRSTLAGLHRQLVNMQYMVSSIDELTNVVMKQTEFYKQAKEQTQNTEQQWSSQQVAGLLKLKMDEKDQLEGSLNIELGNIQQILSFDNRTIERLPEIISVLEQGLKQGKQFHYLKFVDNGEFTMAFPTEMGFPFVYTYNTPVLSHFHGKIEAQIKPESLIEGKFQIPETVSIKSEIRATLHGKVQGHISFVAPFEHQQYVAGYDKVFLAHVPLRTKIDVDVQKMQVHAEFEPLNEQQGKQQVMHYSTLPFTTKADLLKAEPFLARPTTQVISQKLNQGMEYVFGKKEIGMALRVECQHEQRRNNLWWLTKLMESKDPLALLQIVKFGAIERSQLNVFYLPQESTTRKVAIKLGYQQDYKTQGSDESNASQFDDLAHVAQTSSESFARQQDFVKKVSAGIKSVHTKVVDAQIEFQGQQTMKYTVTGAVAKSNVDQKSRFLVLVKSENQMKPFELAIAGRSLIPNTNGLDLTESLRVEPQVNTQVKIAFGENLQQSASKIHADIELRRSESRKQYLLEEPMYHECKRQMQEGNHQLPACANMTIRANKLDDIQVKIQHENMRPEYTRAIQHVYNALRYQMTVLPHIEIQKSQQQDKQIRLRARFAPNLRAINVTLQDGQEEITLKNIKVDELMADVFVAHPVFHIKSRLVGKMLGYQNYRPYCVIDQTEANTYSNRTYSIRSLPTQWTVMMQYVPEKARQHQQPHINGQEQLKHQLGNYLVLVRQNKENPKQKDVKITFNEPRTQGKILDITLQPAQNGQLSGVNPKAKVFVGQQQVQINGQQSHDIQGDLVQIYALPNGEVKIEVHGKFYAIYDGERVKLTLLDGQFRDQIRGLCGQFNEQKPTDFQTPDNCIIREEQEFVQSWNAEQPQKQQRQHCYRQEVLYANVISKQDLGHGQEHQNQHQHSGDMCTKYQTRYVEQNGEICFTIRPMPVCNCQQRGTITKNVAVHCVKQSNVANLWKSQIQKGASPDFGSKTETRKIQMELPRQCSQ
ncbi:unnamed protein product [Brassicogethes aeneus]|uniref:Vitellogenin n=1 Tax=Brassicogethes aeneus TaxID=1431903 RepID=A0A9P0BDI9_BRAAE|nr:unnamed protein product [Brassicogethes aeneus]